MFAEQRDSNKKKTKLDTIPAFLYVFFFHCLLDVVDLVAFQTAAFGDVNELMKNVHNQKR